MIFAIFAIACAEIHLILVQHLVQITVVYTDVITVFVIKKLTYCCTPTVIVNVGVATIAQHGVTQGSVEVAGVAAYTFGRGTVAVGLFHCAWSCCWCFCYCFCCCFCVWLLTVDGCC